MAFDKLSSGRDVPNDLNVVIEIPMNGEPIKYEVDKASGAIFCGSFYVDGHALSVQLWLHSEHSVG